MKKRRREEEKGRRGDLRMAEWVKGRQGVKRRSSAIQKGKRLRA